MAKRKDSYTIKINRPETEEGMEVLRKKMGEAYLSFVKAYILELPMGSEEKNVLYQKVVRNLGERQ